MKYFQAITILLLGVGVVWEADARVVPLDRSLTRAGFERIDREHGVTVYKHRYSPVLMVAAEGWFKGSPDEVARVLLDYHAQRGRIGRMSEAKIINRGKRSLTVYQRLNLPVINDRDFVLRVKWGDRKDGGKWIIYKALRRPPVSKRKGIVRVVDHTGGWLLRPSRDRKSTYVRFQTRIDLSGWLPRWMAKSGAGEEVPQVFVSLRKMLKDKKLSRR